MKIEHKKNYILINSEENTFLDFLAVLKKKHFNYTKNHIIINISDKFNASKENISLFLEYADKHRANSKSFVLVLKAINIDDFPEELNIVPTLGEAEDVIEMENIQRDLGF